MKKINNFLEKASLWKVWLVLYPIITVFAGGFVFILDSSNPENNMFTKDFNYLKFGAFMSVVFTTMSILMLSMVRKSQIFWDSAKELEGLIDSVKTKDELSKIYFNEYKDLVAKCQGFPQDGELKRLRAIIETRYKYWVELEANQKPPIF